MLPFMQKNNKRCPRVNTSEAALNKKWMGN
jgi:hypothetical protein